MNYLIITCSKDDEYKQAIQNTLAILPEYITPIIVGKRTIGEFPCKVVYTTNNNNNEMEDIKQVINECYIQDEDMIIKLTGTHFPTQDHLFKHVNNMMHETDAFVKFFNVSTRVFDKSDSVFGFFGLRCTYLKRFVYKGEKSPGIEFATFIHETIKEDKIESIRKLHAYDPDESLHV